MADGAIPAGRDVVLGFDAVWGFASPDLTSPALAAAAGALTDASLTSAPVTELRIHGVSGSDGPTMLEHPTALQVGGDKVTGFYRRWSPDGPGRPSVPWKLEAYSWGGLTESPLASASWILLAPLMMYNVAYFMLPPQPRTARVPGTRHLSRDAGHMIASVVLRLLALAATVQLISGIASVALSTVAWQAASRGLLPSWLGWYSRHTAGWRLAVALAAVGVTLAVLWLISVKTASKYEARKVSADPVLNERWPLTQPGFWKGELLVRRQRSLHLAAGCAAAALIAALPASRDRWALAVAAVVLAAAAVSIVLPFADRQRVTLSQQGAAKEGDGAGWWCRGVLIAAVAALAVSAAASIATGYGHAQQPGTLPGLTGFLVVLLAVQVGLLVVLALVVAVLALLAGRAPEQAPAQARPARTLESMAGYRPYLGGCLSLVFAGLAFVLGGLLTAVMNLGVAQTLGMPVAGGLRLSGGPPKALQVPWPVYAFGAALAGLAVGAVLGAIVLGIQYFRNYRQFTTCRPAISPVAADYAQATAGATATQDGAATLAGDTGPFRKHRNVIGRAWAVGLIADGAGAAIALIVGGGVLAVLVAEAWALRFAGTVGAASTGSGSRLLHDGAWPWHDIAWLVALPGTLLTAGLVALLRAAYTNTADRKTIGALWDVATFWPRAVHPLAPPCYGERAMPEVVDRIRLLTGDETSGDDDPDALLADAQQPDLARAAGLTVAAGPVLLDGYSQGTIIAIAVAAQLPAEVRANVSLLTLACPARRLYGRAFPAYFGWQQLATLRQLLSPDATPVTARWKNLVRRSDYIGSWIFTPPAARLAGGDLRDNVDQLCWDPVILVSGANLTPPPIHRHSCFWQDPRTAELSALLVGGVTFAPHD